LRPVSSNLQIEHSRHVENRPPSPARETGSVKFFDRRKRIGFIIPDKGAGEVFLHEDELSDPAKPPRGGDLVEFTRVPMPPPLRPKAVNVVIGGKK
jgi:cold shock CspA family protein